MSVRSVRPRVSRDIRSFGQPTAQQALFRAETRNLPVSKVAFGPAWAGAAVATSQALFALDVTPACTGNRFSFIAEGVYADVKWDSMEGGRLYAARARPALAPPSPAPHATAGEAPLTAARVSEETGCAVCCVARGRLPLDSGSRSLAHLLSLAHTPGL